MAGILQISRVKFWKIDDFKNCFRDLLTFSLERGRARPTMICRSNSSQQDRTQLENGWAEALFSDGNQNFQPHHLTKH